VPSTPIVSRSAAAIYSWLRGPGTPDGSGEELESDTGNKVETLAADLTDSQRFGQTGTNPSRRLQSHAAREQRGRGRYHPVSEFGRRRHEPDDRAECGGGDRLTYAAVPAFVKRGVGVIVKHRFRRRGCPRTSQWRVRGTKAYVLGFSQLLRHELANTGVKVQVVLPGATATDLWRIAGKPVEDLPQEIVMTADNMVDAAIAGFDQGEFVTIPALPDAGNGNLMRPRARR